MNTRTDISSKTENGPPILGQLVQKKKKESLAVFSKVVCHQYQVEHVYSSVIVEVAESVPLWV